MRDFNVPLMAWWAAILSLSIGLTSSSQAAVIEASSKPGCALELSGDSIWL